MISSHPVQEQLKPLPLSHLQFIRDSVMPIPHHVLPISRKDNVSGNPLSSCTEYAKQTAYRPSCTLLDQYHHITCHLLNWFCLVIDVPSVFQCGTSTSTIKVLNTSRHMPPISLLQKAKRVSLTLICSQECVRLLTAVCRIRVTGQSPEDEDWLVGETLDGSHAGGFPKVCLDRIQRFYIDSY